MALAAGGVPDIVGTELMVLCCLSRFVGCGDLGRELLENPKLARQYGAGGRRLAEAEFSLQRQAAAYIALYHNLIDMPRGAVVPDADRAEAAEGAPELALVWELERTRAEVPISVSMCVKLRAALETTREQIDSFAHASRAKTDGPREHLGDRQDFREKYVAAHERAESAERRYWEERRKPLRLHVREAVLEEKIEAARLTGN